MDLVKYIEDLEVGGAFYVTRMVREIGAVWRIAKRSVDYFDITYLSYEGTMSASLGLLAEL